METNTLTAVQAAQVGQVTASPDQIILKLSKICERRFHAYNYYPHSVSQEKWQAITDIRYWLAQARLAMTRREKFKICLNLELSFHVIADRRTKKLTATYLETLNAMMDSCRSALNYQKQY